MSQEDRTKVVVRLLPPSLTEEAFKDVISNWLEATNWFSYWKGKPTAPVLNHSRAYLNFKDPADVYRFKAAFDGHAFLNERGTSFRCSVEFAPNQRIPKGRGKRDIREGTVEEDADYKEFVKQLEEGPQARPSAEAQLQAREAAAAAAGSGDAKKGATQTALMVYLKEKHAKKAKRMAKLKGPPKGKIVIAVGGGAAGGEKTAGKGGKKGKKGKASAGEEAGGAEPKVKEKRSRRRGEKGAAAAAAAAGGDGSAGPSSSGAPSGGAKRGGKGRGTKAQDKPPPAAAPKILQRPAGATGPEPSAASARTVTIPKPAPANGPPSGLGSSSTATGAANAGKHSGGGGGGRGSGSQPKRGGGGGRRGRGRGGGRGGGSEANGSSGGGGELNPTSSKAAPVKVVPIVIRKQKASNPGGGSNSAAG